MTTRRLLAGIVTTVVVVVAAVLLWRSGGVHHVRQTVSDAGAWAPVLFVLLQGVVTITPLPRTVFIVAAGVLFGTVGGVLLCLAGTAIAALASYWLVRFVGGSFVKRHAHRPGVAWVQGRLDHNGLLAVLSLRMIPMVPFAVLNYAAGLARVRVLSFLAGTVLGVLPGTIGVVVLGDAAIGGHPHPALFAVSIASGLIGLAGAVVAARRAPTLAADVAVVEPEPDPEPAA